MQQQWVFLSSSIPLWPTVDFILDSSMQVHIPHWHMAFLLVLYSILYVCPFVDSSQSSLSQLSSHPFHYSSTNWKVKQNLVTKAQTTYSCVMQQVSQAGPTKKQQQQKKFKWQSPKYIFTTWTPWQYISCHILHWQSSKCTFISHTQPKANRRKSAEMIQWQTLMFEILHFILKYTRSTKICEIRVKLNFF